MSALIPILPQSPELRAPFRGDLRGTRTLCTVIERGIARGEIAPPRNPELLEALYRALSLYRLVLLGEEADADFARSVLHDMVMPLLEAPRRS